MFRRGKGIVQAMARPVLLVDDDPDLVRLLEFALSGAKIPSASAGTGAEALARLEEVAPEAVVLDLGLPDMDGKEVLAELRQRQPELPVVVLTASSEVSDAVACMQLGASDYVNKPCDPTRLLTSVRNAITQAALRRRVEVLASQLREQEGAAQILGESAAVRRVRELVERAADSDVTVLLLGESGTGKEVAARAIHAESERRTGPFLAVNCGAIPENLIESELFGHAKGAFTGATSARAGRFEQAEGGTLFLDEVGELRVDLQVKLLRVLQERVVQRLGEVRERPVDLRVIAATNRDLKARIEERAFREDLYYRLAVFPIELPPLRERERDVLILAHKFLERFARRHRREIRELAPRAVEAMERYRWPGNVRELENVIERAVILEDGEQLTLESMADEVVCAFEEEGESSEAPPLTLPEPARAEEILPMEEEEKRILARALRLTEGNVREASRRLGIGRATMYRKIERYELRK